MHGLATHPKRSGELHLRYDQRCGCGVEEKRTISISVLCGIADVAKISSEDSYGRGAQE